jgi:FAD/FMN-containing dehydrogenase
VQQAQRIWRLREETELIDRMHRHPPSFDVSVPGGAIDAYVARIQAGLSDLDPAFGAYVYGHLADGNLHITVAVDGPVAHEVHAAIEDVLYAGLREIGGSFSAEHGVGIEKRQAYARYADPVKQELARALKALLDPKGVLNPGKIISPAAPTLAGH